MGVTGFEIPVWGVPSQPCRHMVDSQESVMMSSANQTPCPCKDHLLWVTDVIGTIRISQRSNSGELTRIVMLCVHFLTCY